MGRKGTFPEDEPPYNPYQGGQEVHGDVRSRLRENEDAFGKLIADGTANAIDLPAHFDFSPERYRYFENGTRTNPADSAKFTDDEAFFLLEPAAGDTLEVYTAERPRYVVGYDARGTTALQIQSGLGTGDTVEAGLDDFQTPDNRAFFEFNGDGTQRAVLVGDGSEVAEESFELPDPLSQTDPMLLEVKYNWYNVGRYQFLINYTDATKPLGERQRNEIVAELVVDDDFATGDGNYHLYQRVDATTSNVAHRVGSFGYNVLGDVRPTTRRKSARVIGATDNYSGTGDYEPLLAVRIDPDRGNVYTSFDALEVTPDGGSGEMIIIVAPETETDATGFTTPVQHSAENSVVEQTTNVTTFPDSGGNIVTSAADPNGYQVGFSATELTGQGATQARTSETRVNKRPLFEDDVALFLYKADTATARTVNIVYVTEQDW